MWCFWRCPLPSCAGKQTFSHTLRIHPFAKLRYGSEIWISAWKTVFICLLKCFFLLFCVPNVKKQLFMLQSKFWFFSEIIFYGIRTFLLIDAHVKMLTLNFDSRFLRSITMANFHQILKVRIVSKSELSWLSKNVQNCNPRYPRSWEIAYF